jgi:threonine dehydrogenase-like Zn-dependent dehydrogenase
MRAIVLDRPGAFRVAEVPDPAPRPAEIVVRVECCGIWAIGDTVDGAFAEYVAVPVVSAYRLPPHLDGQYGAMAEPLPLAGFGTAVDRVRASQGIK